jgi:hypothetical protein
MYELLLSQKITTAQWGSIGPNGAQWGSLYCVKLVKKHDLLCVWWLVAKITSVIVKSTDNYY